MMILSGQYTTLLQLIITYGKKTTEHFEKWQKGSWKKNLNKWGNWRVKNNNELQKLPEPKYIRYK